MKDTLAAILWFMACVGCVQPIHSQIMSDWPSDSVLFIDHTQGYMGHGVSFFDFDQDGYDDLTFGHHDGNLFAYRSQGDGTFVAHDLGIGATGGEIKAVIWVDIDGDSDLDLLVTQRLAQNKLWVQLSDGTLSELPEAGGLAGSAVERTFGASVGDYDNDGDLDIYLCQMHNVPVNTEPNRLFQNQGGVDMALAFVEVTEEAGVGNGAKPSLQSSWVDLNKDGWLDLHVINDRTIYPDAFYQNMQDGTFIDMSETMGLNLSVFSMSSSFADYDKDMDWDVFVSNGPNLENRLMRCAGSPASIVEPLEPAYQNVAGPAGIEIDDLAWAGVWFDADNSGSQDLMIATGTSFATDYPYLLELYPEPRTRLYLNDAGFYPFVDVSQDIDAGVELSFSAAYGDADADGSLEVAVHRMGSTARLLHGQPGLGNWLQVLLQGSAPNTHGIGSVVTAWSNGEPDMRVMQCGTQYLSQNSELLHFGLGNEQHCDSLVVRWPNGELLSLTDLPANTRVLISQTGTIQMQGCTYPVACNFNPQAMDDNGTCEFSCLCGSGTAWDAVLGECIDLCDADFSSDGVVSTADLILFLTMFGANCPD